MRKHKDYAFERDKETQYFNLGIFATQREQRCGLEKFYNKYLNGLMKVPDNKMERRLAINTIKQARRDVLRHRDIENELTFISEHQVTLENLVAEMEDKLEDMRLSLIISGLTGEAYNNAKSEIEKFSHTQDVLYDMSRQMKASVKIINEIIEDVEKFEIEGQDPE
jgi:hypothetical protein